MKKQDRIFLVVLLLGLGAHLFVLFAPHFLFDETFYISIPYRLTAGDSLIRDEWHLSQFSSLFSYLPVLFWITLKGSADGIIVFMRCTYLAIHTGAAVAIYRSFRKENGWAIIAAMLFYIQVPYKIYGISYNSMLALFLLLFTLNLIKIYHDRLLRSYVVSGFAFGAGCVCNPLFTTAAPLYLLFCVFRQRRKAAQKNVSAKGRKNKKNRSEQSAIDQYGCFFSNQAALYTFVGIAAIVVISVIFYFGTGGRLSDVFGNMGNLLRSSEYSITSGSLWRRIQQVATAINSVSLHLPFLLPLFFLVMYFDRKRNNAAHQLIYLIGSVILAGFYIVGMYATLTESTTLILALPFFLVSTVCYILTERKNKTLFYCMWCPCAVASVLNMLTANTVLSSVGFVLAVANVAGVFFARDLIEELRANRKKKKASPKERIGANRVCRAVICVGLSIQFIFYGFVLSFGQLPQKNSSVVSEGPYSGMRMADEQYDAYTASLRDLDLIKERSNETDPVLIVSYQNWMYLYIQRPIAVYTTWYRGNLKQEDLTAYYMKQPDKIPKYIYIVYRDQVEITGIDSDNLLRTRTTLNEMFDYTEEKLKNGVLLTVHSMK